MKKMWIAAIAAAALFALAGCSDDPDGRRPAAQDACQKSVSSSMKHASFKDVQVDDHGDGTYTVNGLAGQWEDRWDGMRYYDFTCEAHDDGLDVVGKAHVDVTSGRQLS